MLKDIVIRNYQKRDHNKCLELFRSNCPPFFDESEFTLYKHWLGGVNRGVPVHQNVEVDHYYIMELNNSVVGCGGFYLIKSNSWARLSWGMIESNFHKKGLGQLLFEFRFEQLKTHYPNYGLALDTSQHTYQFYQKMGFKIEKLEKNGYAEGLHKYEMRYK